jgi:DNA-binding response OmpR family regulator
MNDRVKILVIEDEEHIAEGLKLNLSLQGHDVQIAANGVLGLKAWREWGPDLIVLDIMMPELDGFGVLKEIRPYDERLPILILSARSEVQAKIKALERGVDDYLEKPFDLDEFLLRVKRLLKKREWIKENEASEHHLKEFSFGPNHIDFIQGLAQTREGEVKLTVQELKLLKLFFLSPNTPLNRHDLLKKAWGYDHKVNTRTLDNFMVRFRKYFEEDPKHPEHFQSVRGVGYVFKLED